jgi:hypothetical protein
MSRVRGFMLGAGLGLLAAVLVVGIVAASGGFLGTKPGISTTPQQSGPATAGGQGAASIATTPQRPSQAAHAVGPSSIVMLAGETPSALAWATLPLVLAIALGIGAYLLYSRGSNSD